LDNEIAFNEAVIEEREQGIHEIQQQIGEVNEIFKDLAVLVHEQGTMIGKLNIVCEQRTCFIYYDSLSFLNFPFLGMLQMILAPILKIPRLQQHRENLTL
jgi:hypothetical protein